MPWLTNTSLIPANRSSSWIVKESLRPAYSRRVVDKDGIEGLFPFTCGRKHSTKASPIVIGARDGLIAVDVSEVPAAASPV